MRRATIPRLLALLAALLIAACGGADRSGELDVLTSAEAPVGLEPGLAEGRNVVVIVIDTLRADHLPFYGFERDTAPYLTSLADRGVVFERAWSTSSWTAPATASLFTSTHPNEHGVTMGLKVYRTLEGEHVGLELNRIPESLDTLPTVMKSLGYRTFGVADNPNIGSFMGFDRGFDEFVNLPKDTRERYGDKLNEVVTGWKDELLAGEPYFLYLHYIEPHSPYRRHDEYLEQPDVVPEDEMMDLDAYASEIRYADERIRELGEMLSWDDNTLIVFASDHGQAFDEHGHKGHGFYLYNELTQIPLFVHLSGEGAPVGA